VSLPSAAMMARAVTRIVLAAVPKAMVPPLTVLPALGSAHWWVTVLQPRLEQAQLAEARERPASPELGLLSPT
jgi:hypothetical protein